uniref:Uncharacterized protein n=1 Tax=Manihot esculenta TaxID=3983 RepID=A0A2C9V1N0_MANES
MWLEWLRSPSRAHTSLRRPAEPPSPRYFSCSSFKVINVILLEEQNGFKSQPQTPRRPSIFHRVRIASPLHRNHSKTFIISPWREVCWRAEEIKEMNESGELSKLIGGLPFVGNNIKIKFNSVCDVCGGLRYVLCAQCNGSHKIYSEKHGFRTCTSGLIKCGLCYPAQLYFLIYR